jgi:hypothetical protein
VDCQTSDFFITARTPTRIVVKCAAVNNDHFTKNVTRQSTFGEARLNNQIVCNFHFIPTPPNVSTSGLKLPPPEMIRVVRSFDVRRLTASGQSSNGFRSTPHPCRTPRKAHAAEAKTRPMSDPQTDTLPQASPPRPTVQHELFSNEQTNQIVLTITSNFWLVTNNAIALLSFQRHDGAGLFDGRIDTPEFCSFSLSEVQMSTLTQAPNDRR